MELKIFLGKNKTGKTYEIYKLFKKNKKNMFYISNKEFDYYLKNDKSFSECILEFLDSKKKINLSNSNIYEILKFISKLDNYEQLENKTIIIDEIESSSHPDRKSVV